MLLGLDVGTTSCKAGLFDLKGALVHSTSRPTPTSYTRDGHPYYHPDDLWGTVAAGIRELLDRASGVSVESVGVASMAEAGLTVNVESGSAQSRVLPWYDTRAMRQVGTISRAEDLSSLFRRSGLHPSFKVGLAKLLWLREEQPTALLGAVWLSVADFVAYSLTGSMGTDPTLAVRTFAYRLEEGVWDEDWIRSFSLEPSLFPPVQPSGTPVGTVSAAGSAASGLPVGTPVGVSGHDHICALLAAGIIACGAVLDSVGTAESLIGVVERLDLGQDALASGLSIVPHVIPDTFCWLGGIPAAGGSVEWFRRLVGDNREYSDLLAELGEAGEEPTGILYFPYLSGGGAPWHDPEVRAAFIGLDMVDGRPRVLRAVLEGISYATESIRRAAERLTDAPISELLIVGGGARNPVWLQLKADITGATCRVPTLKEATLQGAALCAGLGVGALSLSDITAIATRQREQGIAATPDLDRHRQYLHLYESAYLTFEPPLHRYERGRDKPMSGYDA